MAFNIPAGPLGHIYQVAGLMHASGTPDSGFSPDHGLHLDSLTLEDLGLRGKESEQGEEGSALETWLMERKRETGGKEQAQNPLVLWIQEMGIPSFLGFCVKWRC